MLTYKYFVRDSIEIRIFYTTPVARDPPRENPHRYASAMSSMHDNHA
jgi:hypothetical protein